MRASNKTASFPLSLREMKLHSNNKSRNLDWIETIRRIFFFGSYHDKSRLYRCEVTFCLDGFFSHTIIYGLINRSMGKEERVGEYSIYCRIPRILCESF